MIRIKLKFFLLILLNGMLACGHAEKGAADKNTTAINSMVAVSDDEAFSDLTLDSAAVEQFIRENKPGEKRAEQMRKFYRSRDYHYAWFNGKGLAQQARAFWNLHNNYLNYAQDSTLYDQQLHRQMSELLNEEDVTLSQQQMMNLELELTDHFFDYAHYAYAGRINPDELQWHIPRKKVHPVALLDSLVSRDGKELSEWEPVNQQYKLARKELKRLYEIQKQGGWPQINRAKEVYRVGDSAAAVTQIKQRLKAGGDYLSTDLSAQFTPALEYAVQSAQQRFGLVADGVVGPRTIKEWNVPVEQRIKQLLVNMERMRWMPAHEQGTRLVANIPEFRLHVLKGDKQVFDMKIVVGKAAHETVVFNDKLKYIVFSPYWNVPRSIVRNEILPQMKRNPSYLAAHNMEKTGERGGLPVIRQRPGGSNALGRVKFLFPNSYSIYFHDTPAKSLFDQQNRAFSHGCIRLEQPTRLARYLLRDRKEWTDERITDAMYSGSPKWVTLKDPIPVEITYFTAWVDENGKLNFRDDIYGHDRELAEHLFDE